MATIRVSDVSGEVITQGGASLSVTFADGRRGSVEVDLTDQEVDRVMALLQDMEAQVVDSPKSTRSTSLKQKARSPRAGAKWTKREEDELRRLWQEDRGIDEIAKALRRERGGVEARLSKLGITDQPAPSDRKAKRKAVTAAAPTPSEQVWTREEQRAKRKSDANKRRIDAAHSSGTASDKTLSRRRHDPDPAGSGLKVPKQPSPPASKKRGRKSGTGTGKPRKVIR